MKKTLIIATIMTVICGFCFAADVPAVITPATSSTASLTPLSTDVPYGAMFASATTICASLSATIKDWQVISPLNMKGRWHFRMIHKDKPNTILNVVGLLDSKTVINGNDYYYYFVPAENKGNVVRFTKDGAFIRNLKFPVFGFIFVDVLLEPEMQYLKFPLVKGDTWESKATGTVFLMNFFKITRQTSAKFTVLDEVEAVIDGKKTHIFRIASEIDEGDGKIGHEEHWYAMDIGLVYQNTDAYNLEIYKYLPDGEVVTDAQADTTPAKL